VKLICPACNSRFNLEEAAREALHQEMVDLASKFGRNLELVSEYIDCFRQEQFWNIQLKKRIRLLKELWRLFETNEFRYQGKRYKIDWARIIAAMTVVVNADKFGFKNHNYLKRIMMTDAEMLSAEGLTAKEEQAREEERQTRETDTDTDRGMTGEEYKQRHRIESLTEKIGQGAKSKEHGG